jgi:hypothetical protein
MSNKWDNLNILVFLTWIFHFSFKFSLWQKCIEVYWSIAFSPMELSYIHPIYLTFLTIISIVEYNKES